VKQRPDSRDSIRNVHSVLNDIVNLVGCTPKTVGESEAGVRVISRADTDKMKLCTVLEDKSLFGAL